MKDSLYTPEHFVEREAHRLAAFPERHAFGTLTPIDEGAPIISHGPLLIEPGAGTHGRLSGHLARANPHGRLLAKGEKDRLVSALGAVFGRRALGRSTIASENIRLVRESSLDRPGFR